MANLTCPHCGAVVDADQAFCPSCAGALRIGFAADSPDAKRKPSPLVWIVVVGLLGLCGLSVIPMSILLPALAESRSKGVSTACLANVKQLAVGTLIYAADWNDRLFITADFRESAMPYIKSEPAFSCPQTKESYRFNANLVGAKLESITSPSKVPLVYEGEYGRLALPHQNRGAIGFADGSARLYYGNRVSELKWKP